MPWVMPNLLNIIRLRNAIVHNEERTSFTLVQKILSDPSWFKQIE